MWWRVDEKKGEGRGGEKDAQAVRDVDEVVLPQKPCASEGEKRERGWGVVAVHGHVRVRGVSRTRERTDQGREEEVEEKAVVAMVV